MQSFDLFNLIKANTYFKGKGSWISSNGNKVIRPVLNFLFFFTIRFHKYKKALKSTKKHQKAPKSIKKHLSGKK